MYTFWDHRRYCGPRDVGLHTDPLLPSNSLKPNLPDGGLDCAVRGMQASSNSAPAEVVFS